MPESHHEELAKIINYMKAHWPSKVKEEWQVKLEEYPEILQKVLEDLTPAATKNHQLIRIAGISGSGKTTQILPAVENYCEKNNFHPILIAARRFVEYHPYFQEIKDFYGEKNLRKNTDEFSTIMLFLTLTELIKNGYDIILDVTLLDPEMEGILLKLLKSANYQALILMIATSPTVTEHFLKDRAWRHTKETEEEFIRATLEALKFYAEKAPELHIIMWSVYDKPPVYDGPVKNCLDIFTDYSNREQLPTPDDDARREAKIDYLITDLS
ncbi:zeta toxin family protein [Candidatus Saccharibacteria bacterium]|nr:zeta toxin family protein [Candidatus Saccharibacteria bacterium]